MEQTVWYSGETRGGVKHGRGSYRYPTAGGGVFCYEGPWEEGKKHGQLGKFTFSGGAVYEGEFRDGEMTGKGCKSWADGRKYEGDFLCGEMHGKGVWRSSDEKEVYEGEFMDNHREGMGFCRMKNGDTYSGAFSCHRFHGKGTYLRENNFVMNATFERGVAEGTGSIQWHKAGSYSGDIRDGCLHGKGQFSCFDGSYRYEGEFEQNKPKYEINDLHVYVDKNIASDAPQKTSKKKDNKSKKTDTASDVLGSFSAGQGLGKLIVLISTSSSDLGEHPDSWKAPLAVPIASEMHRTLKLRLREYFPPAPPGKGEPAPDPDPEKELGQTLPLWHRVSSLEELSSAWERFPAVHARCFVGGRDILSGEQVEREGDAEAFTKDELGMTSSKLSQSADSALSISLKPRTMRGAAQRLTLLTDFRLSLDGSLPLPTAVVNGVDYDLVHVMGLHNKVCGMESKSHLELVLLKPSSIALAPQPPESESQEDTTPVSPWTGCLWELRLSLGADSSKSQGEEEQEPESDQEPGGSSQGPESKTVCRWADSEGFSPDRWHSVGVSLVAESSAAGRGQVQLAVDGTGRMKVDSAVLEEGIAAAWLPAEEAEGGEEVELVLRVGGECSFGGFVKSLVVIAGHPELSAQDMTCALMDQAPPSREDGGDLPEGCAEVLEVEVKACGGRACVEGLMIPASTSPGTYVLEVLDGVDPQCLQEVSKPETVDEQGENNEGGAITSEGAISVKPSEVGQLCKLVPPARSSLMKYKLAISS